VVPCICFCALHTLPNQALLTELCGAVSATDEAVVGSALHNHSAWQGATDAFQRRLAARFPTYRDIWLPFDVAAHQLRHGLGLVALAVATSHRQQPSHGTAPPSDAAVFEQLLAFPLPVSSVQTPSVSLSASIDHLLSLAKDLPMVSSRHKQSVTALRTALVMAALARVRLWQAVGGAADSAVADTAADVISLVHRAWAVGQQEAAAAAAAESAEASAKHYDGEHMLVPAFFSFPVLFFLASTSLEVYVVTHRLP
jgi:hypothetical protein